MKRFFLELYSLGSRFLNVIWGGYADITFSAASYIERRWTERPIDWVFRLVGERNHCRNRWDEEVARSRRNIELDRQRREQGR